MLKNFIRTAKEVVIITICAAIPLIMMWVVGILINGDIL
jgi:hypothetical protein